MGKKNWLVVGGGGGGGEAAKGELGDGSLVLSLAARLASALCETPLPTQPRASCKTSGALGKLKKGTKT